MSNKKAAYKKNIPDKAIDRDEMLLASEIEFTLHGLNKAFLRNIALSEELDECLKRVNVQFP